MSSADGGAVARVAGCEIGQINIGGCTLCTVCVCAVACASMLLYGVSMYAGGGGTLA